MNIKSLYKKTILILFAVIISASLYVNIVSAIGASPLRATYSAFPGEIVHGEVLVVNTSDVETYIVLDKENFEVINEQGEIAHVEDENYEHALKDWLQLPTAPIYINAGNATIVPYEIHIPKDAKAQGYYGLISLQLRPANYTPEESDFGLAITARISHLILLEVKGADAISTTSLESFEMIAKPSKENTIETKIAFKNIGNTHSSITGALYLLDTDGNPLAVTELNPGENSILPNTTRAFTRLLDITELGPGTYNILLKGKTSDNNFFEKQITIYIDLNNTATTFDYEYPDTKYDLATLQALRAKELHKLQIEQEENSTGLNLQIQPTFIQKNHTIIGVISIIIILISSILIINYTLIAFKK